MSLNPDRDNEWNLPGWGRISKTDWGRVHQGSRIDWARPDQLQRSENVVGISGTAHGRWHDPETQEYVPAEDLWLVTLADGTVTLADRDGVYSLEEVGG